MKRPKELWRYSEHEIPMVRLEQIIDGDEVTRDGPKSFYVERCPTLSFIGYATKFEAITHGLNDIETEIDKNLKRVAQLQRVRWQLEKA